MTRLSARPAALPSRDLTALVLSGLLLATLGSLLYQGLAMPTAQRPELTLRQVALAAPPPPPPAPPKQHRSDVQPALTIEAAANPAAVAIARAPQATLTDALPLPNPDFTPAPINWEQDLAVNWDAFAPEALDAPPQVLTLQRTAWPSDLSRRNIDRAVVRLDVMIDERGTPMLISILENPHPALSSAIGQIVRGSRFTPPTRNGQAVRARFVWPLELRQ
ncbi:energy transducer TonB [Parahaliea mediterranea]|uniref:energy transducer TonB n=1 Tax=Parahaliea mediterranea TaxID=651086 RepID=UPI000E2F5C16|nr:energy transducer TonB [Parahaliea mediterranea]